MKSILVQKYGGVTLSTPEKIKLAAKNIIQLSKSYQLIVVVSAMGKTTNELIDLAKQIADFPDPREMDMLLSTGERMSMALLSMAIKDLGGNSISLTGSQAGIMTDDSHINALIKDVKPIRVQESLLKDQIVILAGFQGVSPVTKEITTLGRGGSDTTAVAFAAYFEADRCEILKEVPGVLTADPKKIPSARLIGELSYEALLDMTFWGAQVLHYRSVELAALKKVPLFVGLAKTNSPSFEKETQPGGTMITADLKTYESSRALAVNSHRQVLELQIPEQQCSQAWQKLRTEFEKLKITLPQLLFSTAQLDNNSKIKSYSFFVTGPTEVILAIQKAQSSFKELQCSSQTFSTVTLTCSGVTSATVHEQVLESLQAAGIAPLHVMMTGLSLSVLVDQRHEAATIEKLHGLISAA